MEDSILWVELGESHSHTYSNLYKEPIVWLEIIHDRHNTGGYFLHHWNRAHTRSGDTWHQSLDDAMHQAEYMHCVTYNEWLNTHD